MPLLPPTVAGPLSVLNSVVEVQGQVTDAEVTIFSNNDVVAKGTATSADQVFPLLPGKSLQAGQHVSATQDDGSGPSARSPHPVSVQSLPTHLGDVAFWSPVFACTEVVEITGAYPGATVVVGVEIGGSFQARGQTQSPRGSAGVFLNAPTQQNETLVARQTGGGMHSPLVTAPSTLPTTKDLPTPILGSPLVECRQSVEVSNLVPGAVVTVSRASGTQSGAYVANTAEISVDPPLGSGEVINVRQAFPGCGYQSGLDTGTVAPAATIPVPKLSGSLCPNSQAVSVSNLLPGARVRIFADSTELGEAQAPSKSFVFSLPPGISAGQLVTAKQQLCNKWSDASNALKVGAQPSSGTPSVRQPLHACAGAVHVDNVQPGSWVQIVSSVLNAPIGEVLAPGSQLDILVAPSLIANDTIHARISGCGAAVNSASVTVGPPLMGIKPPTVAQTVEGMTSVSLTDVVPGAFVDVFVNNIPRASLFSALSTDTVDVVTPLALGDKVKARQRLCTITTAFSTTVVTVPPPPVAKFSANPTSGPTPLVVQFTDESTGELIDQWDWNFQIGSSTQQNPQFQFPSNNPAQVTPYQVSLRAHNPGGWSAPFTMPISVLPPPPHGSASASPTVGSATQTVTFSAGSVVGATAFHWDFDDPTSTEPTSDQINPTHDYPEVRTYHPTLTVSNAGGSTSITVPSIAITQKKPLILVSGAGPAPVKFTVTGSGYEANVPVTIFYSVPALNAQGHNTVQSNALGGINGQGEDDMGVCSGQTEIEWRATDGRPDQGSPDGKLWSNTYKLNC